MRRHPRRTMIAVAASAFALVGSTVPPAHAADPVVVADGLVSPLSVAVADNGTVYVTQNFASTLTRVPVGGGAPEDVFTHPDGAEVGAVSATDGGAVFATTGFSRRRPTAHLWSVVGNAAPTKLANLYRYEKQSNPDGDTTYGLRARPFCLKRVPKFIRPYQGRVESHPYATALGTGVTYVADAAGNSILAVADDGGISTVGTLPRTKVTVTRKMKREFGLHKCVIGKTYRAEGVPTDVEIGPDGDLYVTSLPGVPGEGLPTGRIYRFDPADGSRAKVRGGLVSPTGLAISPTGTAYVAQIFAGSILQIPPGGEPTVFAEVPFPGDVEFEGGSVYATETDIANEGGDPAGRVVSWPVP